MDEIVRMIKEGRLWAYTLDDGGVGIVSANSEEEARKKVIAAYEKYGGYEDGNLGSVLIFIWGIREPFDDAPDVLEIHG